MQKDILYFETSSVNCFANNVLIKKDSTCNLSELLISPVVLVELLLTKNIVEKEKLLLVSQRIFGKKLLLSPSEIIINYINNGCPIIENKYDTNSNLYLSKTWETSIDLNQHLTLDNSYIDNQIAIIRKMSKLLDLLFNDKYGLNYIFSEKDLYPIKDMPFTKDSLSIKHLQIYFENIINQLSFKHEIINENTKTIYKLSIFFILFILCAEFDIENEPIRDFWQKRGINDIKDRVKYIFTDYEILVRRGPFITMAITAYYQFKYKFSRGLFFDCLHSIYLPYVSLFITNDKHFEKIRDSKTHDNFLKIVMFEEIMSELITNNCL